MSRYFDPATEVVFGWDNPLQYFFVQVFDETGDDLVADFDAPTLDKLIAKCIERNVPLPNVDIQRKLWNDYETRTEPTDLQKWAANMLGGFK